VVVAVSVERPGIDVLPEVRAVLGSTRGLLIDGEHVDAADGATFETVDPATGEVIARVARGQSEDVDRAVRSARRALEGPWRAMGPSERERVLRRLADLIDEHGDELAQLDSLDSGKPVTHIRAVDVPLASGQFRYFAGWPTKIEGRTLACDVPDMHVYTRREPIGVVAAIVPWNFPLTQASFKLAPALAAGCTAVLKPAEQTPLSAIRLGELALEAGIPAGVLNVCTGFGDEAGAALVDHPGVARVAFTGSNEVGKEIARRAAENLTQVSLELGGKSPNIIFPDADVEAAAINAASAIFFYTGQVCSAGSRLMVHDDVYDDVLDIVVREAKALRVGPGLDPETTLGPLISQSQRERVLGYIDAGIADGASVLHGGLGVQDQSDGYFVDPTVLSDVSDDLTVVREEIFGPVLVAQRFSSIEELAARANATQFGLAAGVWTSNVSNAHKLAALLEAGTVWINCYNQFAPMAPWGGYKQSGYGRDGGEAALEEYLHHKTVWTNVA
jgi:phenylacetaldehyde dehydrogenase